MKDSKKNNSTTPIKTFPEVNDHLGWLIYAITLHRELKAPFYNQNVEKSDLLNRMDNNFKDTIKKLSDQVSQTQDNKLKDDFIKVLNNLKKNDNFNFLETNDFLSKIITTLENSKGKTPVTPPPRPSTLPVAKKNPDELAANPVTFSEEKPLQSKKTLTPVRAAPPPPPIPKKMGPEFK